MSKRLRRNLFYERRGYGGGTPQSQSSIQSRVFLLCGTFFFLRRNQKEESTNNLHIKNPPAPLPAIRSRVGERGEFKQKSRAIARLFFVLLLLSCKTISAIDFFVRHWFERNLSLRAAFWTNGIKHLARSSVVVSAVFSALVASFWFVCKSFFCIEFLFTCRENKLCAAILTNKFFVLEHGFSPSCSHALNGLAPALPSTNTLCALALI